MLRGTSQGHGIESPPWQQRNIRDLRTAYGIGPSAQIGSERGSMCEKLVCPSRAVHRTRIEAEPDRALVLGHC